MSETLTRMISEANRERGSVDLREVLSSFIGSDLRIPVLNNESCTPEGWYLPNSIAYVALANSICTTATMKLLEYEVVGEAHLLFRCQMNAWLHWPRNAMSCIVKAGCDFFRVVDLFDPELAMKIWDAFLPPCDINDLLELVQYCGEECTWRIYGENIELSLRREPVVISGMTGGIVV